MTRESDWTLLFFGCPSSVRFSDIVNHGTIVVQYVQEKRFWFVHNHVSVNYFKKGIDIFCDICYTVITEEKELLKSVTGAGEILNPRNPGFHGTVTAPNHKRSSM